MLGWTHAGPWSPRSCLCQRPRAEKGVRDGQAHLVLPQSTLPAPTQAALLAPCLPEKNPWDTVFPSSCAVLSSCFGTSRGDTGD